MKIIIQQKSASYLKIWNYHKRKKGNSIIVTIILSSLCLIMVFSMYKYKMQRLNTSRIALDKCITLRKDDAVEIIFTSLLEDIKTSCSPLNSDTLKNYLSNMLPRSYNDLNAEVYYSSDVSMVAIKENLYDLVLIKYYKVFFEGNKVCFKFSHRKYENR